MLDLRTTRSREQFGWSENITRSVVIAATAVFAGVGVITLS
jgi:hypothetical protein